MPSDRQRKDECDQQMDEMVETVAPQAENAKLGISFSSHGKLGHHAGILVLQNVTVRHIRGGSVRRMRESHQDFGYTAGRDRGDVLPAGALGFRRLAVPREDAELTAMDVNGM